MGLLEYFGLRKPKSTTKQPTLKPRKPHYGDWYVQLYCKYCKAGLTEYQHTHSQCCPHCGALSDCTILNTITKVVRDVTRYSESDYFFGVTKTEEK